MPRLAAIALFALAMLPDAQALTIGAHLHTVHFGANANQMQDRTPGLYLRTDNGFTLGHYRNSHGHPSTYAGWTWETDNQRFALTAGLVNGYGATPHERRRLLPLLVPSMRLPLSALEAPGRETWAARIAYVPKPPRIGAAHGLHFTLERKF